MDKRRLIFAFRDLKFLENIRIAAEESMCLLEIVGKIFKEIARLVASKTPEEALTRFEEGTEGGERDEVESGGVGGEKDEEPEIVEEGFDGRCGLETRQ
jgi:hypothetical protein